MARCQQSGEAGFTLVEVIVALAILAVSLSVLLGVISNAAWQTAQAEKLTRAGSLAQSLLAKAGIEMPLRQGDAEGEFSSGFHWRVKTLPYGDTVEREAWPIGAYTVSAEVSWNDGFKERSVVLTTLRLAPKGTGQ
ncbi:MAG TPA: type II secretion system protein [Xanthobacteraceae bacterium]|jgi:general secretion pathway protein I